MRYILNILTIGLVIFGLNFILHRLYVEDYLAAVCFALVLSILNVFVRPLLIVFSLPITIITFGLFLLVINTLMIILTDKLLDGISIANFWYALLLSLCISATQSLIDTKPEKKE